jgi:hypothetical protein
MTGPKFDFLVTVTILRDGEEWVDGSDSDQAGPGDLEEMLSALGSALGRAMALEALERESSCQ